MTHTKHDIKADAATLATFTIEFFLRTGEPVMVKQLAEESGWPLSRVRKTLRENHGLPGCVYCDQYVDVIERNYKSVVRQMRVGALRPTTETLRQMILTLRERPWEPITFELPAVKPTAEPCHWCNSTSGTTNDYDGYDRCVDCKGC